MKAIFATLLRELQATFFSPLAYAVATFFLLINGYVFWFIVSYLNNPQAAIGAPLELFFGQTVFFWLVLLFITPVGTMRALAEERRSGTIEVLMTAPVTAGQVVVGKYLAALAFFACLWLPTLAYVGIVAYHGEVDWGPIASGYLGTIGVGALFLAVGIFASCLARNQIVAAVLTFAVLIVLFTFGLLENLVNQELAKEVFGYLDLWRHMEEFSKGIVDTRHLVYYLSSIGFFLFLATQALETRKWR